MVRSDMIKDEKNMVNSIGYRKNSGCIPHLISRFEGFCAGFPAFSALIAFLILLPGCTAHSLPELTADALSETRFIDIRGRSAALTVPRDSKVHIVHFFATWCFTCLAETPALSVLASELGSCGLSVRGVGMDLEGWSVLKPYLEVSGLSYPVYLPGDAVREGNSPFGRIRALPTTFVFDGQGRLLHMWEGPAETDLLRKMILRELGGCEEKKSSGSELQSSRKV